ncbi:MAG TPA: FmdB family zinc ribbon protein [Acidimicrobiales bacterium]|nr:FmdB family zinc ribbon protein [Acidimicrobiales bacterium]
MPVYEYVCKACGHHLEVSQSFKDEPLSECPVCAGPLRKVFGSIGIVLKGSGFYRTDSRLPAKKEKAGKAEGGSGGDKAADAKDAKPAAPPPSTAAPSDAKPSTGAAKTA